MSLAGACWHIDAVLKDKNGSTVAEVRGLQWADSFVSGWHAGHLGEAIKVAFNGAKESAVKLGKVGATRRRR